MTKLTPFGITLRKLRIDHNLRLSDLATKMGHSLSMISAVETGRKTIPAGFVTRIISHLELSAEDAARLRSAEDRTIDKVDVTHLKPEQRELVGALARRLHDLPDEVRDTLRNLLF